MTSKLGIGGTVLSWFCSYLSGRSQRVAVDYKLSKSFHLGCGVPQGSCLGPLLFNIYCSSLIDIVEVHLPEFHSYADDSQLYLSFSPSNSLCQDAAVNQTNMHRLSLPFERTSYLAFKTSGKFVPKYFQPHGHRARQRNR